MATKKQRERTVHSERDAEWISEANAWAKSLTTVYFEQVGKTGQHTVADILAWLDNREDMPTAWIRWLDPRTYQTRYQMVRNACVTLAKEGYVETGETYNAKGKQAVSYIAVPFDDWTVEVDPATDTDRVTGLVRGWVHAHRGELQSVQTIVITRRVPKSENVPEGQRKPNSLRRRPAQSDAVPGPASS